MLTAVAFALCLQSDPELEAALKADRERIAAKRPLSEGEVKDYTGVADLPRAKLKPRASYRVAVVALEFPDAKYGVVPATELARVAEFYKAMSAGAFELVAVPKEKVALDVSRADWAIAATASREEKKPLERVAAAIEGVDGVIFIAAGANGMRGTALWPHKDTLELSGRAVDYLLVPEKIAVKGADGKPAASWHGVVAHEFGHLLGLEDKYEDRAAKVDKWCLMGTGYLGAEKPMPLCGVCRERLGWASAGALDAKDAPRVSLAPGELARIPVARGGGEALVLEMREGGPLLVWHTGGGKPIELAAVLPTKDADRLTPYSDPPFLGRTLGSSPVWLTDVRIEGGRAYVRIVLEGELTPLEELRRSRVGKTLGK